MIRADGNRMAYATGFMVSPRLLLTNWHVLPTDDLARLATAQFGSAAGPPTPGIVPGTVAALRTSEDS